MDYFSAAGDFVHEVHHVSCSAAQCALEPLKEKEEGLIWNEDAHREVDQIHAGGSS